MVKQVARVELTESFLAQPGQIEIFLAEVGAAFAYDELLAQLRATIIPDLRRFPRIGRRFLDYTPQSTEAMTQLSSMPKGIVELLREYLIGDYLILYAEINVTIYLLSIRHHRQLSFDFQGLWPILPLND